MNKEGYSGVDGRTSIFDYWSVDSLRNWYNDGNFGEEKLTDDQVRLRNFYIDLLKLSNQENSISQGGFFDLMYANYDNPKFDPTKQYVFLRGYNKELLMIVVNFDSKNVSVDINIPDQAFEYFEIDKNSFDSYKNLLTKKSSKLKSGIGNQMNIEIDANSGVILKFSSK